MQSASEGVFKERGEKKHSILSSPSTFTSRHFIATSLYLNMKHKTKHQHNDTTQRRATTTTTTNIFSQHISDGPQRGRGGQRRQDEVNKAIKAVIEEQARQRSCFLAAAADAAEVASPNSQKRGRM